MPSKRSFWPRTSIYYPVLRSIFNIVPVEFPSRVEIRLCAREQNTELETENRHRIHPWKPPKACGAAVLRARFCRFENCVDTYRDLRNRRFRRFTGDDSQEIAKCVMAQSPSWESSLIALKGLSSVLFTSFRLLT